VSFGDGASGMIPPALTGNIRLTYRKGGGTAGNQPAGAIAQLKSAIPYIQKVSNCEAASGGTDPETDEAMLDRGPLGIRHGGRAVTREDYEDLAMLASNEVARAKCVPLVDLTSDPDGERSKPGVISVILVPRSIDPRPRPSLDLFERVRVYLDERRQLIGQLKLVGPEYVRVDVECEITIFTPESAPQIEMAAGAAIASYLHPVSGGHDGAGWNFGREPKRSDFYGLLEDIPGVGHVRELRVSLVPDRPGSEKTGRFLICCGNYQITTTLKE
jgi:predicted phage baseplate assembly protein